MTLYIFDVSLIWFLPIHFFVHHIFKQNLNIFIHYIHLLHIFHLVMLLLIMLF